MEDVHWLIGLPGIGKTTAANKVFKNKLSLYIESDDYRESAWQEFVSSDHSALDYRSKKLADVYSTSMLAVSSFVEFHSRFSPFFIRHVLDRALVGVTSNVVIEASVLHSTAIPRNHAVTVLRLERELYEERLAKSLSIDKGIAESICWTYVLSECLLGLQHLRRDTFDVDSCETWSCRFT